MELTNKGLLDRASWEAKGYRLPEFDREAVKAATKENPCWIHFGPGNLFRAFQANVLQNLLNKGELDRIGYYTTNAQGEKILDFNVLKRRMIWAHNHSGKAVSADPGTIWK